jgi:hypothetical protein
MLAKYNTIKQDCFEYVHNRLQAGIKPPAIVREIRERFFVEIAFAKCPPDMIDEFLTWIVEAEYYVINREFYDQQPNSA